VSDDRAGADPNDGADDAAKAGADASWPVALQGVTESVVATLGPNEKWNFAALGLHASDPNDGSRADGEPDDGRTRAYTWGRTRTWRNFGERGGGYVQFTRDPVAFVESALGTYERDEAIHPSADAWVRVAASSLGAAEVEGTRREEWALEPVESSVVSRTVPTTRRGYNAVVEATVAASRLDVPAYDTEELRSRLSYFERVVETCGDAREREAMARIDELVRRR
jgi:hypothetical protein